MSAQDPRIGKDVIARNGTFAGVVCGIKLVEGQEYFNVVGYSVLTATRGMISDVKPEEVVPIFQDDEELFMETHKEGEA